MASYSLGKLLRHISGALFVWIVVGWVSEGREPYPGFTAAFLGACYLLSGWLSYLKSQGTDVMARLKRKEKPEAPYFHRREKNLKPKAWCWGNRHRFDDDMDEILADDPTGIPLDARQKLDALAFALVGLVLLALSML